MGNILCNLFDGCVDIDSTSSIEILDKLPQIYGAEQAASMTSLIPSIDAPEMGFTIFLLYIFLLWWTVGNTDGGNYFAQRMISAKNEKHAFLG